MTEDEAKTKACFQTPQFDPGNGDAPRCCASACLAWRTVHRQVYVPGEGCVDVDVGFCGLAGLPQ